MTERIATSSVTVILLLTFVHVWADYELEVNVRTYTNPTSKCEECTVPGQPAARGCCDDGSPGTESCEEEEQCDNSFMFCLRPYGVRQQARECPLGSFTSQDIVNDKDDFVFGRGMTALTGLPNPLVFNVAGRWHGGIQLHVSVTDTDMGVSNELVDEFIIDKNITVEDFLLSSLEHYEGIFNLSTINLSFQVQCTNDSYGSDCSILCVERDDDQGHYTCDSEGNRICRDSYQNPETNCTVPADAANTVTIIVGAAVGGIVAVTVVIALAILLFRYKKKSLSQTTSSDPTKPVHVTPDLNKIEKSHEYVASNPLYEYSDSEEENHARLAGKMYKIAPATPDTDSPFGEYSLEVRKEFTESQKV